MTRDHDWDFGDQTVWYLRNATRKAFSAAAAQFSLNDARLFGGRKLATDGGTKVK